MNYRLMKKLILFVGVFVGILSANIANAESPVWGTYKVECPANSDTYIGITTTRAPVFTGKVQSVQSGTTNIVAQGEPNWSANQFVYVAGSQTNHYYLKFTSGELEGAWYDIKSNGAYFAEIEYAKHIPANPDNAPEIITAVNRIFATSIPAASTACGLSPQALKCIP